MGGENKTMLIFDIVPTKKRDLARLTCDCDTSVFSDRKSF